MEKPSQGSSKRLIDMQIEEKLGSIKSDSVISSQFNSSDSSDSSDSEKKDDVDQRRYTLNVTNFGQQLNIPYRLNEKFYKEIN